MNKPTAPFDAYNTNREAIEDSIIIMENIAADARATQYGITSKLSNEGLYVSFQAYKWTLRFNVLIQDPKQIERMTSAIEFNKNNLQTAIPALEAASSELSQLTFHGHSKLRAEHKEELKAAEPHSIANVDDYIQARLSPYQDVYDKAKSKVFRGPSHLRPDEYLKELGVLHTPAF